MSIPTPFNPLGTLGGGSGLPPGYTLLKCLVAHGTEYIDTGITECVNFALELDVNLTGGQRILGTGPNSPAPLVHIRLAYDATCNFGFASLRSNLAAFNRRATYRLDPDAISRLENGEVVKKLDWNKPGQNNFTLASSIKLLASVYADGTVAPLPAEGKCYGAKAWSGETLVMVLVPALNPDGEPVMYDLVGGVERPNLGTGNFGYETL